ncbi:ATP-grasp domain-containing protein [Priestia flexa]|uniref:ATP-grasp domain-containing protein n=1 Tax=Priestia flexa TaxID=86664 RepID=UPI000C237514|nr:ATP-grasp domain-containing protein [Priestia flexa]MEC0664464.1 ATP-grasp domain-containing protein [Priestia flexa]MED3824663.1 ATP-grasp domain-containing protein [Priestia flexa]
MKTIVFVESNKSGSSREAIRAADKMGYFTVLLTNRKKFFEQISEFVDVHHIILTNTKKMDSLREEINKLKHRGLYIELIASFVHPFVSKAAILSKEFCNTNISADTIADMEDKITMRQVLKESLYNPFYYIHEPTNSIPSTVDHCRNQYPLIIKAPLSTGSKDVYKVNNEQELTDSIVTLENKYGNKPVLIEQFIDGPQYLIETLTIDKILYIVSIFEQEITKQKRFIVTGYRLIVEPSSDLYHKLLKAAQSIVDQAGMENGACHFEFRLKGNDYILIELNPRISGGAMNRMIEAGYGINLVEKTLNLMLGNTVDLKPKFKKHVYIYYITMSESGILEKITGKKRAKKCPGIKEVFLKPKKGTMLYPPLSMGHRYAYVLAIGDTPEQAEQFSKTAAKEIVFHLKSNSTDSALESLNNEESDKW